MAEGQAEGTEKNGKLTIRAAMLSYGATAQEVKLREREYTDAKAIYDRAMADLRSARQRMKDARELVHATCDRHVGIESKR